MIKPSFYTRRPQVTGVFAYMLCQLVTVAAQAAVSDPQFGSSPIPVGAGPRALGMGGAFSAVADDATAATWNPAGMTQLERPEIGLSLGWYNRRVTQSDGSSDQVSSGDLDHASVVIPYFAFGCQQSLSLAWQRQFDFSRSVSAAATITTMMATTEQQVAVDTDGALSSWGLSYALELQPGLSVGATLHLWNDNLTGRSHYRKHVFESDITSLVFPPITTTNTLNQHSTTTIDEGYSTVFGLWWQALPQLTVAGVFKPAYHLNLETDRSSVLTFNGVSVNAPDTHQTSKFYYPNSATLGLGWRHDDLNTITCDTTWTQWSHYRLVENGTTSSPISSYLTPDKFSDGWSVRVGYEHLSLFDTCVIAMRCGALYEELPGVATAPSAAQPQQTHATIDRYIGATVGSSLVYDHIVYDLGGQVRYGRDVGTGQDAPPDQTADITSIIVRLGATYHF